MGSKKDRLLGHNHYFLVEAFRFFLSLMLISVFWIFRLKFGFFSESLRLSKFIAVSNRVLFSKILRRSMIMATENMKM